MRYFKGILRWPLLAVLAIGVSGCDLEVLNPGSIQDKDLSTPDLMPILVTGVSAEYNDFADDLAFDGAILADDAAGTGSYSTTQVFRQGIFDWNDSDPYWEGMHATIWGGEQAWNRMNEVLGEAEAASSALSARVFALMGHAHNRLGESYCDVAYDIGPAQPRYVAFDSAIIAFNRAIQIGNAAGEDGEQWVLSAYAGIAQARLGLASLGQGTWADAAAAAQAFFDNGGTADWTDDAIYHSQADNNILWNETHGRAEIGVWSTRAQQLYDATGDVRVPYTKCGEWVDTSRPNPNPSDGVDPQGCTSGSGAHQGADGLTAHYRQDKYPERGTDLPRASGVEMLLIQAEAAFWAGDYDATDGMTYYINQARASYGDPGDTGLDPLAAPTVEGSLEFRADYPHYAMEGDADWDAWSMLDQERYAALWLTGKRLFDLDRWDHPFLAGGYLAQNVPGADAVNPRPGCMPIPRNECTLNPELEGSPACEG